METVETRPFSRSDGNKWGAAGKLCCTLLPGTAVEARREIGAQGGPAPQEKPLCPISPSLAQGGVGGQAEPLVK